MLLDVPIHPRPIEPIANTAGCLLLAKMSNHWYNYRGPASRLLVVVGWVGRAAQRCGHHHLRPEGCIGDRNFPSDGDRAKSNTELVSMFSDTGGGGGGGEGVYFVQGGFDLLV